MLRPGTLVLTVALAGLSAFGPLTTDMYLPSLPDVERQLQASAEQVQLTISAYLVGFAIGQVFYGPLADRHGRKPVLLAAITLYCAASLICALSTSIEIMLAARALQGLGVAGGIVVARAMVGDLYSGDRAGHELSVIGAVTGLAPVLVPLLGGGLQTGFGWRSVFLVLTGFGLAGVVVWPFLPETLKRPAAQPVSPKAIAQSYRLLARHSGYRAYLVLASTSYAGLFVWISGASFVLQELYDLSPLEFGVAFAIGSVGNIAGAACAAALVVRYGIDRTLGIGSAVMAAGGLAMVTLVALSFRSAGSIVLPMAVYLAGMGMVLPQALAGALQPFPERAGTALSLVGFVQQTLSALAGIVVGALLGASAWPLVGGVALFGGATFLFWVRTRMGSAPLTPGVARATGRRPGAIDLDQRELRPNATEVR
jgi:MFS transporter, DHA1 family, multidrug resistance protein